MKNILSMLLVLALSACYYVVPANDFYFEDFYGEPESVYVMPSYGYAQSTVVEESYYDPYGGLFYVQESPRVVYVDSYAPEVVYVDNPLLRPRPHEYRHHEPHHHYNNDFKAHREPPKNSGKKQVKAKGNKPKSKTPAKTQPKKLHGAK